MYSSKYNFGLIEVLKPESLGAPGKRVFRLLIDGVPPAAATLWLEKEQLYGLSMAIKNMLEKESMKKGEGEGGESPEDSPEDLPFPRLDDPESLKGNSKEVLEFKVGRLGLAVGPGKDHVTFFFHDEQDEIEEDLFSDDEEDPEESFEEEMKGIAKLQFCIKMSMSEKLANESLDLCASGRGTDAMSRQALVATGKIDPNRNGHFRH